MNRRELLQGGAALTVVAAVGMPETQAVTVEVWDKVGEGCHHYAVSRYEGETRYYLDGKLVGRVTAHTAGFSGNSAQWEQHWGILDDLEKALPDGNFVVEAVADAEGGLIDWTSCQPS